MASENKTLRRGIELYIDGKEVKANMKQVEAEAKKLREEIRGMTVGSKEYFEATKRYQELSGVLRAHREELKGIEVQHQSLFKKAGQLFKDYGLQIVGLVGAISNVSMKINAFRKQAAEKEDAAANLKALTGLDDSNIQWLTQQADKLSTTMDATKLRVRKSATEILEAYMLVGSAKPELLKDKEALNAVTIEAMRLAEAAKMDLKESVRAVTTSLNQFGMGADQASRFVNVLAAGSKYGAANVMEQADAITKAGVAAHTAGLPFEELVAAIELLGEMGVKSEVAGTVLNTFLMKLATGSRAGKLQTEGLTGVLKDLNAEFKANEAAVAGSGMGAFSKEFSERGVRAALILSQNIDKLKEYRKNITDTDVAVEQAAINSDTAAAKLAQIRNQINLTGQELAKTLAPVISQTVGWTRKFVLAMPAMIDFIKKYGVQLAILAVAYNALTIKTALSTAAQKAWTVAVGVAKNAVLGLRAMLLTLHAGYTLLTKGMAAAKVEMMAVNTVMKGNAFGLLITAGIALYEIISRLIKRTKELTKEQRLQRDMARDIQQAEREGNNQRAESESKIRSLNAVIHDNTRSIHDRRIALQELKKIVPDYHGQLTTEGTLIRDNTKALTDYLDKMREVAIQKALQGKMDKLVEAELNEKDSLARRKNAVRIRKDRLSAFDAEYQNDDIIQSLLRNGIGANQLNYGGGYMAVSRWMDKYDVGRHKAERQISAIIGQRTKLVADIKEAEGWVEEVDDRIDNIQKRQQNLQKQGYDIVKTLPQTDTSTTTETPEPPEPTPPTSDEKETERKKRIREELAAIDAEYNKRAADLKQQFLDGDIEKEEDYAAKVQALELERLKKKMDVAGLEPEKQEEIRLKILEIKQELIDDLQKLDALEGSEEERRLKEQLEKNRKAAQDRLNILEKAKAAELLSEEDYNKKKKAILDQRVEDDKKAYEKIAEQRLSLSRKNLATALFQLRQRKANEHLKEKEYDTLILEAKKKFYETLLRDQSLSNEQREQLQMEYNETVLDSVEKRNAELEEKNKKMFDMLKSAGQEIGSALAEMFTDSEKSFADFMKELVITVLNAIEQLLVAYVAQITMRNVATLGIWGLAKAAAEIALITAAFETAKAAIKGNGYEEGGFTPSGKKDEPQGIVHSDEFVANRFAVKNPQVRPVLELIDEAQKSGSISQLTGNKIADVAIGSDDSEQSSQTDSEEIIPPGPNNPPVQKLIESAQRSGSISHLTDKEIIAVASRPATASRASENFHATNEEKQEFDISHLSAILLRLEKVMEKATKAYQTPSKAYCFINGEGGIREAMELDEKIRINASQI